jgi:hypothetical protein
MFPFTAFGAGAANAWVYLPCASASVMAATGNAVPGLEALDCDDAAHAGLLIARRIPCSHAERPTRVRARFWCRRQAWWLAMTANKWGDGVYSGAMHQTTGPPFNAVPFHSQLAFPLPLLRWNAYFHE